MWHIKYTRVIVICAVMTVLGGCSTSCRRPRTIIEPTFSYLRDIDTFPAPGAASADAIGVPDLHRPDWANHPPN